MEKKKEVKEMRGFKKFPGVILGLIGTVLVSVSAWAAEPSVSVSLPVEQQFENKGGQDPDDTFYYSLTAEDSTAPLPGAESEDTYVFSMTGTQDIRLEEIIYTVPGVYRYEVSQTVEKEKDGYQYDESRYTVEVYVENRDGQELKAEVILLNEKGEKCKEIVFKNAYEKKQQGSQGSSGGSSLTGKDTGQTSSKSVKTGDDTEVSFWLSLIGVSLALTLILITVQCSMRRKKAENRNQD
mgnify:CR=1 FL=1